MDLGQLAFDFETPDPVLPPVHPRSATYDPALDHERLSKQARRVYDVLKGGEWLTLDEIAVLSSSPQASVSARFRDLRRIGSKSGAWTCGSKRRPGAEGSGVWVYRLVIQRRIS